MLDLTIVDVNDDALIVTDNSGTRYRLVLDDEARRQIRRIKSPSTTDVKVSPRQIQAHIRAGLSAQEVADTTGASLEYVERFEGPIIAEREHIVSRALASEIAQGPTAGDSPPQFGSVIRERLEALGAHSERWASWREESGTWFIKVVFNADGIDHDARWTFDVATRALEPVNAEAVSLSAPEEPSDGLMPRLRAVGKITEDDSDSARFDSGAFAFQEEPSEPAHDEHSAPANINNSIPISAITRSEDASDNYQDTAELLEALRRRRGQRGAAPRADDETKDASHEDPPHLVDLPLETLSVEEFSDSASRTPQESREDHPSAQSTDHSERPSRKGRASVPSWDEIVFGARGDDDIS